ncbi:MAG TPA: hypothetical protein VN870_10155 [Streptosporangiaceae bacterium]|nr:hypothetical protein [Streptosporangiaceae bacterium]
MPPKAAAEVAVLGSTAAVLALAELLDELLAGALAGAELLEELEELQPAARRMEPTAATLATIALDARKINPPMLPPGYGAGLGILARQVVILANQPERKVARRLTSAIRLVAVCPAVPRRGNGTASTKN